MTPVSVVLDEARERLAAFEKLSGPGATVALPPSRPRTKSDRVIEEAKKRGRATSAAPKKDGCAQPDLDTES
jgi:hypothetical protein